MGYKVLVLGGYGTFGSRIARRLIRNGNCEVIIGGRNKDKAVSFAEELNNLNNPRNIVRGVMTDCAKYQHLRSLIRHEDIKCVVHTAGPYQNLDYSVARAILEAGAAYIDLADSRRYVCDFNKNLDALAKEFKTVAITGASSVPGISSAAIDQLRNSLVSISSIDIGISPGNQTPRGDATVASILSYCGKMISVTKNSKQAYIWGWQDLRRHRYPDPVGIRWIANCDVPDLEIFPEYYRVNSVSFAAGLELTLLQFATVLASFAVRFAIINNMAAFATPLRKLSELFIPFGSTCGAMHVKLGGKLIGDGNYAEITWHLCADSGKKSSNDVLGAVLSGPEIPCTPAVILVNKFADEYVKNNRLPYPIGAYPCLSLFSLDEVAQSLKDYNVWFEQSVST